MSIADELDKIVSALDSGLFRQESQERLRAIVTRLRSADKATPNSLFGSERPSIEVQQWPTLSGADKAMPVVAWLYLSDGEPCDASLQAEHHKTEFTFEPLVRQANALAAISGWARLSEEMQDECTKLGGMLTSTQTAIAERDARIKQLGIALTTARDKFREYEQLHLVKSGVARANCRYDDAADSLAKAVRNANIADRCDAAIAAGKEKA